MYKEVTDESGHIVMPETGDEYIDKWEKELAMGLTPDLEEGYSPEYKAKLAQQRKKTARNRIAAKALDGVKETYVPGNIPVLGRPPSKNNPLLEHAQLGKLDNLDPATIKRMLANLTPEQAQEILQIINR